MNLPKNAIRIGEKVYFPFRRYPEPIHIANACEICGFKYPFEGVAEIDNERRTFNVFPYDAIHFVQNHSNLINKRQGKRKSLVRLSRTQEPLSLPLDEGLAERLASIPMEFD